MKKMKIRVVSEKPEYMTAQEWKAAKALPEIECNAVTAIENMRNSKGLYEVVPDVDDTPSDVPNFNPDTMTRSQLVSAAMQFGVTLSKKNIQTEDLRKLVTKKYDEFMAFAEEPDEE